MYYVILLLKIEKYMETLFELIQQANVHQSAIIQCDNIKFFSSIPVSRTDVNQINQVVEDLTGIEIATLQSL